MLIADGQAHIWGANTTERPWFPGNPHKQVAFTADELLREMDAAGVDRCVLVPPQWEGYRNDVALEAARRYPDRFAVMGKLDIDTPDARTRIGDWRSQPGMLGIRLNFADKPLMKEQLGDGRLDWLLDGLENAGVLILTTMLPRAELHIVDRVAERYPRLKITIDHLGLFVPKASDDETFADLDKLLPLAKRPNIAVKASALPIFTTGTYPYRSLHPQLRSIYDAFGRKRMFWGTDITRLLARLPASRPCSYRQTVTMFTEEIPWLTAEDKKWIMGRGLCEWLGWALPASR